MSSSRPSQSSTTLARSKHSARLVAQTTIDAKLHADFEESGDSFDYSSSVRVTSVAGDAVSQGTIKRRMEKKLGRPMNQDEVFKETHIVKKKKETNEEKWVEGRASNVHDRFRVEAEEFIHSQPPNESGAPFQLSAEDIERLWTRAAGGPK